MSVTYQQLLHDVGLRMSALAGTQLAGINASYDTGTLTSAQFKSVDWPFTSFRDAILMAEAQFAEVAAYCVDENGIGNHSWRANMAGVTTVLGSGAVIPATDSTGVKIIGAYGEVIDGTDSRPLTRQPLEDVRRIADESTWRIYPIYGYNIVGRRLFHTRATAIIGVCVYNRTAQSTAFSANGAMLLPDTAEPGIAAMAISLMTRETAFAEQAANYHKYATEALLLTARGGVPSALPAAA